jgi:RluA family pseudouridine synthase
MKRNAPYTILHEDDDIVVVNKASGIAVLADRWDDSKERLDELLNADYARRTAADPDRPPLPFPHRVFVVHRIDRDTSGLVVFAKNAETHKVLSSAFESRKVEKTYIAVIHGSPAWKETLCDLPLRPDGDRDHRTVIDKARGKHSVTHFKVLGTYGHLTVVEASPETGRTHQIRVHAASLGHAIVGDPLYGDGRPVRLSSFKRGWKGDPFEERPLIERLALHAARLRFEDKSFTAPLARDLTALVSQMEKSSGEDFGLAEFRP